MTKHLNVRVHGGSFLIKSPQLESISILLLHQPDVSRLTDVQAAMPATTSDWTTSKNSSLPSGDFPADISSQLEDNG